MDIHPIVVHFPVAFLTLYAIFELIRFQKVLEKPYWFYVKKTLILLGWVGALAAASAGLVAVGFKIEGPRLFMLHEVFALSTIVLSTISAIFYLKNKESKILIFLALLIFASITITGGLGGAMVYSTHFDPFMTPVFKLLGVY